MSTMIIIGGDQVQAHRETACTPSKTGRKKQSDKDRGCLMVAVALEKVIDV